MTWRERILAWKPEIEWKPILDKWQKDNSNPLDWFILWIWPENEDVKQTELLKQAMFSKGIQFTERKDYGNEMPASVDSVVYCLGDITVENIKEFDKITVDDKMVYYENVPVALIGAYMDEELIK